MFASFTFRLPVVVLGLVEVGATNPAVDEKYAKFSGSDIRFATGGLLRCCGSSVGVAHLLPSSFCIDAGVARFVPVATCCLLLLPN